MSQKYNDYMKAYMLARYHRRRQEAINKLGGKCIDCGSYESLEFDHADANEKEFSISKIWSYSEIRYQKELDKCVLRCHGCHVEKSRQYDWRTVEHGGGMTGKRGCTCELCRKRKNEYMRNWKRNREPR